jgi:hypothetical protein
MDDLVRWHSVLNGWVWGPVTMALLMGTGLYLTLLTRGVQFRWLAKALREVLGKVFTKTQAEGTVTMHLGGGAPQLVGLLPVRDQCHLHIFDDGHRAERGSDQRSADIPPHRARLRPGDIATLEENFSRIRASCR